jgi:hypothetical protein
MEKNKLLQEEINRVKTIMGLTEDTDMACADQLEEKGYNVKDPSEVDKLEAECEEKHNIKCVKAALVNANIDEDQYEMRRFTSGECYIMVSDNTERGRLRSLNLTFWEDGSLTFIGIFKAYQKPPGRSETFKKFQFDGKYKCDPNTNTINHTHWQYSALRDENNEVHKPIDFKPVGENGVEYGFEIKDYFSDQYGVGENDDTFKIINKLT